MSPKLLVVLGALVVAAQAVDPLFGYNVPNFAGPGHARIVGGQEAQKGEFPHQVSLQWSLLPLIPQKHFCGGTIINSQWILTAGHCVLAIPKIGIFSVKAGKHDIKTSENTEQKVDVSLKFVHEKYVGNVAPYDIALLKLKSPLSLNKAVMPISLPEFGAEPTGNSILSGWGSTSPSGLKLPRHLQKIVLPLLDYDSCKSKLDSMVGGPSPLHTTNICTAGSMTDKISACSGDSGGPLIQRSTDGAETVIGVVSWGVMPCGSSGAPSVYTSVAKSVDWIQTTIENN